MSARWLLGVLTALSTASMSVDVSIQLCRATWLNQTGHDSSSRDMTHPHGTCLILTGHESCMHETWHAFFPDSTLIQPIADRVAQHREIISKNFQFSTRRTRILMGSIIYFLVVIVNSMGRILVCWKVFEIISRCCATLSAIGCVWDLTCSWVAVWRYRRQYTFCCLRVGVEWDLFPHKCVNRYTCTHSYLSYVHV